MSSDGACFGQTTQLGISPCFEQLEIGISDGMYVFLVEIRDQVEVQSKDVIPVDFSSNLAVQSCLHLGNCDQSYGFKGPVDDG